MASTTSETTTSGAGPEGGWIPEAESWAERLLFIRTKLKLSQVELAALIGYPASTVASWEQGSRCRDQIAVSMAYSERLGVDLGWIITGRPGGGFRTGRCAGGLVVVPLPAGQMELPFGSPQVRLVGAE